MRSVLAQTSLFLEVILAALRIMGRCRLGEVPIHNNFVERQIKQYALGRKLWMFVYDKVGAQASANLFSLVMTARANGVEPFEYLHYLFEQMPSASTVEAVEALLPWNFKPLLKTFSSSV
jgi:IS66 C-terminal element/Transposase IS66 family